MATLRASDAEVDAVLNDLVTRHGALLRGDDDVYVEDGPYADPVTTSLGTLRDLVSEVLDSRARQER